MAARKIVLARTFVKSYKKFSGDNHLLKESIARAISELERNPFAPHLRTHKLSGNLFGLFACSCGYDCRIVFSVEKSRKNKAEIILLVDIGTHDDIY